MTDFFETRVENMESKEDKKKSSADAKKSNKKNLKKRKQKESDASIVESSEEFTVERCTYSNYSHSKESCNDLCAMINKHK